MAGGFVELGGTTRGPEGRLPGVGWLFSASLELEADPDAQAWPDWSAHDVRENLVDFRHGAANLLNRRCLEQKIAKDHYNYGRAPNQRRANPPTL